MSGVDPRDGSRADKVGKLQIEVRALMGQGLSVDQIESRLATADRQRNALGVILRYEIARAALEEERARLNSMLAAPDGKPPPKRRKVLGREEPGHADYGARRDAVMSQARARVRQLAAQGLPAGEIQGRLDYRLTDTERELMAPIIREEVVAARRARVARSIDLKDERAL